MTDAKPVKATVAIVKPAKVATGDGTHQKTIKTGALRLAIVVDAVVVIAAALQAQLKMIAVAADSPTANDGWEYVIVATAIYAGIGGMFLLESTRRASTRKPPLVPTAKRKTAAWMTVGPALMVVVAALILFYPADASTSPYLPSFGPLAVLVQALIAAGVLIAIAVHQ